jgi:RHS repeat-associated protein
MQMPGKTVWSLSIEQEEVLSKMVKYTQNISYSFGMHMQGRSFSSGSYRYGFNGKESDDEVSGSGNQYDYGFRIYNPRIGKFLSIDPLTSTYPWYTPFQYAGNSPIVFIDLDGLERVLAITFNGDVNYRANLLELATADEISTAVLTINPGEQLAQAFIDASSADENGIGFVAIWGHGSSDAQWGTASNSNTMTIDDLEALRIAVANGDINFTDNAIIYIGNCNAGTCDENGESFAQEIADITGVTVIAGEGSVGMSKTQATEEEERMEYSMDNTYTQDFKMFEQGEESIELGGVMDVKFLLKRGKQMPLEKMKPREIKLIPVDTPEPIIQTR